MTDRPEGITDDEWAAIQAHRRDSAPKRKGSLRGTDPETGNTWELELTVEEAAKLAGKALGGLFSDDAPKDQGGKDTDGKPKVLKDYFSSRQKAG